MRETGRVTWTEAATAWFTFTLGILVAVMSTVATILQLSRGDTGS